MGFASPGHRQRGGCSVLRTAWTHTSMSRTTRRARSSWQAGRQDGEPPSLVTPWHRECNTVQWWMPGVEQMVSVPATNEEGLVAPRKAVLEGPCVWSQCQQAVLQALGHSVPASLPSSMLPPGIPTGDACARSSVPEPLAKDRHSVCVTSSSILWGRRAYSSDPAQPLRRCTGHSRPASNSSLHAMLTYPLTSQHALSPHPSLSVADLLHVTLHTPCWASLKGKPGRRKPHVVHPGSEALWLFRWKPDTSNPTPDCLLSPGSL